MELVLYIESCYSGVRLIAIALIASYFLVPKRPFNVNIVPLISSSPISKANFVQDVTCYYANTTVSLFVLITVYYC